MTFMEELQKNLVDVKAELNLIEYDEFHNFYEEFKLLCARVEKQEKRSKAIEDSLRSMLGLLTPESEKDANSNGRH